MPDLFLTREQINIICNDFSGKPVSKDEMISIYNRTNSLVQFRIQGRRNVDGLLTLEEYQKVNELLGKNTDDHTFVLKSLYPEFYSGGLANIYFIFDPAKIEAYLSDYRRYFDMPFETDYKLFCEAIKYMKDNDFD